MKALIDFECHDVRRAPIFRRTHIIKSGSTYLFETEFGQS